MKLCKSGASYCLLPGGWMSGWVHTLGGLFLVTVLQMRPVVVLLLSVKVNNCVV